MNDHHERLHRIRLRHLTCFLAIVRTGSARRAAEALFITESAVSKTLRELETELGLRLFDRSRTGMAVTDGGRRFARYARSAIDALNTGVTAADPDTQAVTTVRIGSMPVIAAALLPQVIDCMLASLPKLAVEVVSGSKGVLLERLRKGDIALVLGRLPPPADLEGLTFEQLFVDRYIFAVRAGHPLASREQVSYSDIAAYPMALPTRDTVTFEELQRAFLANGAAMSHARVETIYLQFSRAYVLGSDAVWACSETTARQDIEDGVLVKLPADTSLLESPLGIIRRTGDAEEIPSAYSDELIQAIREATLPGRT